jgi:hypothetical protein
MSTPRIDLDISERSVGNLYYYNCVGSGGLVDTDHSAIQRRFIHFRPESSTNTKVAGWRYPGVYGHYMKSFNPAPRGPVYFYAYGPTYCPIGQQAVAYTENGYGWDATGSDLPFIPSWMEDQAVSKAYTNLKGSKVNLGVAYAERKETERLFTDTLRRIADGVRSFRKRNPAKTWNSVKQEGSFTTGKNGVKRWHKVPQHWLELQYGWSPLMQDVQGSIHSLQTAVHKGERCHVTVKGAAKNDYVKNWTKTGPFSVTQEIRDEIHQSFKVALTYAQRNPLLAALSSLGLTNPAEIVWERLGFSFVVDWFLPIGGWLSTFDADFGFDYISGAKTEMTRVKGLGTPKDFYYGPDTKIVNDSDPYRFNGFSFGRGVYLDPPGVGWPHFKNPISSAHIANAMSLLTTAFHRG